MSRPVLLVLAAAVIAGGCNREHLGPAFGQANREAMAMQQPRAAAPPPAPTMKLDTQESEIVTDSYLHSISSKAKSEPEPVLYVSPQRQTAQALTPSVPK